MKFYTKCYNGHIFLIDEELENQMVECPYCHEDFIVSKLDDDDLIEGSEEYFTTKGILHTISGLIICGAGVLVRTYFNIFIGYAILAIGLIILFRGLIELFQNRDVLSWFIKLIKLIFIKIKIRYHKKRLDDEYTKKH